MKIVLFSQGWVSSKRAHLNQVLSQAYYLSEIGNNVTLYLVSASSKSTFSIHDYLPEINNDHRLDIRFLIWPSILPYSELFLTLIYLYLYFFNFRGWSIHTRILYFAFIIDFLGFFTHKKFIYEVHLVEHGFKRLLQNYLLASESCHTLLISNGMKRIFCNSKTITNYSIYHDCGVIYTSSKLQEFKNTGLSLISSNKAISIGYFGTFGPGRGLSLILDLINLFPECQFVISGSKGSDFSAAYSSNVLLFDYMPPSHCFKMMCACDILLMPYSLDLSLGKHKYNTSSYMSPLKMFEYMSTGNAIVSSNLPVLSEVLIHRHNSLLCPHDQLSSWKDSISELVDDSSLRLKLGMNSIRSVNSLYNWRSRSLHISRQYI
jgi:glycosyltransferase involved in cell wall biosynthesis